MLPLSLVCKGSPHALSLLPRNPNKSHLKTVKSLVESFTNPTPSSPIDSLRGGHWVKLITGASFEDVADVRNLSLVYTLAGVDCIDCAADASVVNAVNDGIEAAAEIAGSRRPWVMISVNDDREDLHFRKAEFDPENCPLDCSRPCEKVCPANAISLEKVAVKDEFAHGFSAGAKFQGGVITERCYGCGRCLPVCPYDKIRAMMYVRDPAATSELLKRDDVDAIEIHTRGRRTDLFEELWNSLSCSIGHVKLVAVSMPDVGESTVAMMKMMYSIMEAQLPGYNLWQGLQTSKSVTLKYKWDANKLDGRPMSGDIGPGATREAVNFGVLLAAMTDRPHGFYQLAGGTNSYTVQCLKDLGLFQAISIPGYDQEKESIKSSSAGFQHALIGGIAYGGYARKIVGRVLRRMPTQHGHAHIEDYPDDLLEAFREALNLVGPVKGYNLPSDILQ